MTRLTPLSSVALSATNDGHPPLRGSWPLRSLAAFLAGGRPVSDLGNLNS
jgi:hypothetical protein